MRKLLLVLFLMGISAGLYAAAESSAKYINNFIPKSEDSDIVIISDNLRDDATFFMRCEVNISSPIILKGKIRSDVTLDGGKTLTVDTLVVKGSGTATIPEVISKNDVWMNLIAKSTFVISGHGLTITTTCADATTLSALSLSATSFVIGYFGTQVARVPRNLQLHFNDAAAIFSTATVSGLDARGNAISENFVVGAAGFTAVAGNYAFKKINTIAFSKIEGVPTADTTQICVGNSDKIGLYGDIDASADVYSASVGTTTGGEAGNWAEELSSLTVNSTYDTWTHSDVPDAADDFDISYRCNSE